MPKLIPENLKSRSDLKGAIRRVAAALDKLPDDAMIWYEPLFGAGDDKPDFVVWWPDRGIFVLEVFDVKPESIFGFRRKKVHLTRNGAEVEVDSPLVRAMAFASRINEAINCHPVLKKVGIEASAAACLPHMNLAEVRKKNFQKEFSDHFTIFQDEIDGEKEQLRASIERIVGIRKFDEFSEEIDRLVRGIIQPDIVIGNVVGGSKQLQVFQSTSLAADDIIRVMDREQEAIAKSLGDGHRVIRGVAGSGKTLILLYRIKVLARCNPLQKFLLVTYTKALAGQLRKLLEAFPNIDVIHIDKFARDIVVGAKRKVKGGDDYSPSEILATALDVVSSGQGPRYDGVLIDEAQDLDTNSLILLRMLLKDGADNLLVVADAAQNIFKRKFSWKQAGIQAQGRTRILRANYRNTKEILDFASRFLAGKDVVEPASDFDDENSIIPPESSKRTGLPPSLVFVGTHRAEITEAVALLEEELKTLPAGQKIAVLYPGKEVLNRGKNLHKLLMFKKIEHFYVGDDEFSKKVLNMAEESVILCTVHSAKGLEFSRVIVCGTWFEKGDLEMNRKLNYVAMTRATDKLTVVSRKDSKFTPDLKYASQNQFVDMSKPVHQKSHGETCADLDSEDGEVSLPTLPLVSAANAVSDHLNIAESSNKPGASEPLKEFELSILEIVREYGTAGVSAKTIEKRFTNLNRGSISAILRHTLLPLGLVNCDASFCWRVVEQKNSEEFDYKTARILTAIRESGNAGISSKSLATQLGFNKAQVNALISMTLEPQGLVFRDESYVWRVK